MEIKQRQDQRMHPHAAAEPSGDNLDALNAAANRMLDAADSALERVLSGNSEDFLRANRQRGGQ